MELRKDESFRLVLRDDFLSVSLKAMIVHGASWGNQISIMKEILRPKGQSESNKFKNQMSAVMGYGSIEPSRLFGCTEQRATLIGTGEIEAEQAHVYNFPLPNSLSGKQIWRRLTITLSWFSPINCGHQGYRSASLWFDPPTDTLSVSRTSAQWQAVQRGTVQHEVLEGDKVSAFTSDDSIKIQVNCRPDAGALSDPIPYCLVASLEVAEGINVPIYQEIRDRIRTEIRQQTRVSTDS